MSIRQQTAPNLIGQPSPEFSKPAFDAAIWNKGYSVTIERAIECPCKSNNHPPLATCTNCLGTGWVFINPIKTMALMSSLNKNTEYKDWSPELLGTASCTVMDDNKLGFMDKITLLNTNGSNPIPNESIFSEVKQLRTATDTTKFIFLAYKPTEIEDVFIFNGAGNKLTRLASTDYSVREENSYVIEFTYSFPTGFNGSISIRYKHQVQYLVLDIPHDIRGSKIKDSNGKLINIVLPNNAIVRRAHEVLSVPNFAGNNIQDNSYL